MPGLNTFTLFYSLLKPPILRWCSGTIACVDTCGARNKACTLKGYTLFGRQLQRLICVPYEGTWFAGSFDIRPLIRSTSLTIRFTGEVSNRGDSPRLPSSATDAIYVSILHLFKRNNSSMTLAVPETKHAPTRGTRFAFDRGDSPRLPSSATGSGRRGELPTSLSQSEES